jgi:predicted transcriptional regulator
MLKDILVTSDEEAQRLLAAFKAIPNMQGRLKIVELAERLAREKRTARLSVQMSAQMAR